MARLKLKRVRESSRRLLQIKMKLTRSNSHRQIAGVLIYHALWYLMPKQPPKPLPFDPSPMRPWKKSE